MNIKEIRFERRVEQYIFTCAVDNRLRIEMINVFNEQNELYDYDLFCSEQPAEVVAAYHQFVIDCIEQAKKMFEVVNE